MILNDKGEDKDMSQFSFDDYQNMVARAQTKGGSNNVRIGFFKLKNDGDEALVRFNVHKIDDLDFASIHQLGQAQRWMKVNCLTPIGVYDSDDCPFCKAVAEGDTSITPAKKRCYVQVLVSYKDRATGTFASYQPVIWERPAGFSREIAGLLHDWNDLTEHIFKVTRLGAAGSKDTRYNISYVPVYDKPDVIPADFSSFNGFNLSKHSFWIKTKADMEAFLKTGEWPESGAEPADRAVVAPAPAIHVEDADDLFADSTVVAPAA